MILGREQARLREELDTARQRVERASHVLQVRAHASRSARVPGCPPRGIKRKACRARRRKLFGTAPCAPLSLLWCTHLVIVVALEVWQA